MQQLQKAGHYSNECGKEEMVKISSKKAPIFLY